MQLQTPETSNSTLVLPGESHPLGASVSAGGVNFCLFSKDCQLLELLLFESASAPEPSRVIQLDPKKNRTFNFWHCFVPGLRAGQVYGYRAHGRFSPENGFRFDGTKVLLDPYSLAVVNWENYSRKAAIDPGDNCA